MASYPFISQRVFVEVFLQKSIPAQIRQLIFLSSNTKNKLTNLCGNRPLQNDLINAFCEMSLLALVLSLEMKSPALARAPTPGSPPANTPACSCGLSMHVALFSILWNKILEYLPDRP